MIQIPLKDLIWKIYVRCISFLGDVTNVLYTKDFLSNGRDISTEDYVITHEGRRHTLEVIYILIVYKWKPEDLYHALYT